MGWRSESEAMCGALCCVAAVSALWPCLVVLYRRSHPNPLSGLAKSDGPNPKCQRINTHRDVLINPRDAAVT